MARIERIELRFIDIPPKVKRTDAIQSFVSQETPIVTVTDSDGAAGTGYSYTIGTGGSSVMRLLSDHLAPRLIGKDAERVEAIWRELELATHATTVGAISSLALSAIDVALWDLRAKRRQLPLWIVAGGAADRRPLYTTEGGWLHIDERALVEDALAAREKGFIGSKIKIGRRQHFGEGQNFRPSESRGARESLRHLIILVRNQPRVFADDDKIGVVRNILRRVRRSAREFFTSQHLRDRRIDGFVGACYGDAAVPSRIAMTLMPTPASPIK